MIVIAGRIRLDPDKRDAAVPAAVEMMKASNAEPGCHRYAITADLDDPGLVWIFEEWESDEALKEHFATPHMATFQAAMGGFGIQGMQVERYEIASKGPLQP